MASYQAGFNAKARLGPSGSAATLVYVVQRYTMEASCQEQDVSNTEGQAGNPASVSLSPSFSSFIPGLRRFTASLVSATFDALANPFAAPLRVSTGGYIAIRLFLNGTGGVSRQSFSFLVNRCSSDGDVRALQPITISGVGDGSYLNPAV